MVSVAWIVGAASIVDFGIQLVGWAISSAMKTEKYYDLCGSGAFAAVAVSTFACTNGGTSRGVGDDGVVGVGDALGRVSRHAGA